MKSQGKVWLVGAGPGDPGLLTLKGRAVLNRAEVVVYDRLAGDGVLAMIPAGAVRIDAGKSAGNHPLPQEEINRLLIRYAAEGKRVVRLKGGDPFLFGRGGEEAEALCDAGIPYEVVPGVTAASAVPAYFGIPATHRREASSLHLITAHRKKGGEKPVDYKALASLGPEATLVFFMGTGVLEELCTGLIGAGMPPDTPAALLMKGTSSRQRKVVAELDSLPRLADQCGLETPGLVVVGSVCRLSETLSWVEKRPLHGARVFVTRPRDKGSVLSERLSELGAEVVEIPALRTEILEPSDDSFWSLERLQTYNWIVFSSPVGAEAFFQFLRRERIDIRALSGPRFATVGEKTRNALEDKGVIVECCPEEFNGQALAKVLLPRLSREDRVLALTPQNRESAVVSALRAKGVLCDTVAVYRTVLEEGGFFPQLWPGDYAAFASASAVEGFAEMAGGQPLSGLKAVCIGKQTAAAAKRFGMAAVISETETVNSMIDRLVECHLKERAGQLW